MPFLESTIYKVIVVFSRKMSKQNAFWGGTPNMHKYQLGISQNQPGVIFIGSESVDPRLIPTDTQGSWGGSRRGGGFDTAHRSLLNQLIEPPTPQRLGQGNNPCGAGVLSASAALVPFHLD